MINRKQAEHLLDAYVNLENGGGDNKARQSLREVILDAMEGYQSYSYPIITTTNHPNITWGKPVVTCDASDKVVEA
jgi:hypothetical protein